MDARTIEAYDRQARDWAGQYRNVDPAEFRRTIVTFFHPGALTADVGCGSGRDTDWLTRNGFPAEGIDASEGMLREAGQAYPDLTFRKGALPDLTGIEAERYDNVLCSATLMHIPRENLIDAAFGLARILKPHGRLVLSYRSEESETERDATGRLFTAIPAGKLALLLESAGFQVLLSTTQQDATRPGLEWVVLAAEKSPLDAARGLKRIQHVLAHDRKSSTYKLALVRALCETSRADWQAVRWSAGKVFVPVWSLARRWLIYYWPMITNSLTAPGGFIKQSTGEAPGGGKNLQFRDQVAALGARFGRRGLHALLADLDEHPDRYLAELYKLRDAIKMPVKHAGTYRDPLFHYEAKAPGGPAGVEGLLGWVEIPEAIWLDISRFDHWIEESLVLRWAKLTAEMNGRPDQPGEYLDLLLERPKDDRDTSEVRDLLAGLGQPLECVWSGSRLGADYQVDHVIPYAIWGNNDLWNLLPARRTLNRDKSDSIPARALLLRRRDCIIDYWQVYQRHMPERFDRQVRRALGFGTGAGNWERHAFAGLEETVERLAAARSLVRWQPPA